jgi:thiopurine S-methyltransferase
MQADFWHERWQQGQIGFHQDDINPYLQQYWGRLGATVADTVFVPLCGKSADMLWLRAQGHAVLGVELSPLAVQAFFAEHGLQPMLQRQGKFERYATDGVCLLCGDFFDLHPDDLQQARVIYDRASLIALPPSMRTAYAAHMRRLLAYGSRVLLVAFEYPQQEMDGPPFSVSEAEIQALYGAHCTIEMLHAEDILDQEPRFRARGLTRLQEKVYLLTYNGTSE